MAKKRESGLGRGLDALMGGGPSVVFGVAAMDALSQFQEQGL